MPCPFAGPFEQSFGVRQLRSPGEHEIDMCPMERDAADQAFVGTIDAVANQMSRRVKLLDRLRHHLANQRPQLQRKLSYHWIVGREKLLKLATHAVSFARNRLAPGAWAQPCARRDDPPGRARRSRALRPAVRRQAGAWTGRSWCHSGRPAA